MSSQEEKYDNVFLGVAQQAQGIEPLLDVMFSFLRRKTDFFSGASEEKINDLVLGVIKKHSRLHEQDQKLKKVAAEKEEAKKREKLEKKRKDDEAAALLLAKQNKAVVKEDDILEVGEDGSFDLTKQSTSSSTGASTSTSTTAANNNSSSTAESKTEDDKPDEAADSGPIGKFT